MLRSFKMLSTGKLSIVNPDLLTYLYLFQIFSDSYGILTSNRFHLGRKAYKFFFTNCVMDEIYIKPMQSWCLIFCIHGLLQGIYVVALSKVFNIYMVLSSLHAFDWDILYLLDFLNISVNKLLVYTMSSSIC